VDAFEGHLLVKLEGHVGLERRSMTSPPSIEPSKGSSGEEVGWTPDSKYVIGGSLDGRILIWDVQKLPQRTGAVDLNAHPLKLQPMVALDGHPGPSRCVRFNPRFNMMVTAGAELVRRLSTVAFAEIHLLSLLQAFWLPDTSQDPEDIARDLLRKKGG